MKYIAPTLLSVLFLLTACMEGERPREPLATPAVSIGVWTQDYDAALKLAATKQLPVLLNFTGSDWCGWCKLMDRQVFSMPEWHDYATNNLILVAIDFPQNKALVPQEYVQRNEKLSKHHGIQGFPTYILLNAEGQKIGQLGASRDAAPASFIASLRHLF